MSAVRSLTGVKRKSRLSAGRTAFDPERTWRRWTISQALPSASGAILTCDAAAGGVPLASVGPILA